jgi:SAM-dependent methyltransferase
MERHVDKQAYIDMAKAESSHWWFTGRRHILEDIIKGLHLSGNPEILEIGSGTGGNLKMLSQFGKVIAVEMNDDARDLSEQIPDISCEIQAGYAPNNLGLGSRKFDLICLFDVLEHIDQDIETLNIVKSLLAPGGTVIITVPAYRALWGSHDEHLHHYRRYERAELKDKIINAGYIVKKLSFMNMFLLPLAILARVVDKIRKPKSATGTKSPHPAVNNTLRMIFSSEKSLLQKMDIPFGLSLVAIVQAK